MNAGRRRCRLSANTTTATVHGNGCLGAEVPGKMYIDSGGGTAANLHQADLNAFPTAGYAALNAPNTPHARVGIQ